MTPDAAWNGAARTKRNCDHKERRLGATISTISGAYPTWLSPGDNAWQMTAATLVGLMSVPGLVVLYGGVMQKRWSINSMMLAFAAFAIVLVVGVGPGGASR